jgi:PAS domain S-box-containing protein
MSDEQFRQKIQAISQQIGILQGYAMQLSPQQFLMTADILAEISADLGNLQLIYEEMLTCLEAASLFDETLIEQTQQAIAKQQYYRDLFKFSPDAYLVTDANGLILDANEAIAKLLNVSRNYLIRKPLAVFIAQSDRPAFRTKLNQLSGVTEVQNWQITLDPKDDDPFVAQLNMAIARNNAGWIEALRIGIRALNQYDRLVTQSAEPLDLEKRQTQATTSQTILPQALDGLQVLMVDDEADARELIAAVLESHNIRVRAVATAAEALEALERFRPNVLISDIRMPDEDGYSLIRKVRELEAKTGWHIPAAALTAYLEEDRSKAVALGFEAHLHKLAQPTELVDMVTRLARRTRT